MAKQDQLKLNASQRQQLIETLQQRFERNPGRHKGIDWTTVLGRLTVRPDKLWSLQEMERTGGEPDVVGMDSSSGELVFMDCAPESPKDRRSLCYDREALDARKEFKPESTVMDLAASMGISVLTEAEYRYLQTLGHFDTKTSSWLRTPEPIRKLGGAIFGDRRYDHVFIYHNGAGSYYAARGFRGVLKV
ncbi:DUF4256 domain-containing protein [Flavihumibacter rivuli]|uniref:DUF4256 domain-containing protein n=1 Tax=Flavihumibacter rivuli TaxID=2838156 RepID=UPI001BDF4ECB|nr:DUF4256 domain-containing protein [Flavihumibacter rivuli]ULQ55817.1 DUF4256 domain-containing protein [Flavihumibacter rivuli]